MTEAEFDFKCAVIDLIDEGTYPSPTAITAILPRRQVTHNLNGREVRWRAEILTALGWVYDESARPRTWSRPR
jgi:hypothetical protein